MVKQPYSRVNDEHPSLYHVLKNFFSFDLSNLLLMYLDREMNDTSIHFPLFVSTFNFRNFNSIGLIHLCENNNYSFLLLWF